MAKRKREEPEKLARRPEDEIPPEEREAWWGDGDPAARAKDLRATITRLTKALAPARAKDAELLRAFYNDGDEYDPGDPTSFVEPYLTRTRRRVGRANILRSAIETAASQICTDVPEPEVLTTGETASKQRAARHLRTWISGVLKASDFEDIDVRCFVDSCLSRVAMVRVDMNAAHAPMIERLLPHWLVYNPKAGPDPRDLFLRWPVSLHALRNRFPDIDFKDAIKYKPDETFAGIDGVDDFSSRQDDIEVLEGYRKALPGKPDSGRHVIVVGDVILNLGEEEHPFEFHTLIPLRFSHSYSTFAGKPAGDDLIKYQERLDEVTETGDEAVRKGMVVRIGVPKGSGINREQLAALQGAVYTHKPGMPATIIPGVMPPDSFFGQREALIQECYAFMGVNYGYAAGNKAEGIPSAKGQREVKAIADHRLQVHMRRRDRWIKDIDRTLVAVAAHHYQTKPAAIIRAPATRILKSINWKEDIDWSEDKFTVRIANTNALSKHPAARIEEVGELVERQIITDPKQAQRLMNIKDLESETDLFLAPLELAERVIQRALDRKYLAPDPYMGTEGLQALVERGEKRYVLELLDEDTKPGDLDDLRKAIEQAKSLLKTMAKSAAPPAPVDAGAPPGPPMNGADPTMLPLPGETAAPPPETPVA